MLAEQSPPFQGAQPFAFGAELVADISSPLTCESPSLLTTSPDNIACDVTPLSPSEDVRACADQMLHVAKSLQLLWMTKSLAVWMDHLLHQCYCHGFLLCCVETMVAVGLKSMSRTRDVFTERIDVDISMAGKAEASRPRVEALITYM